MGVLRRALMAVTMVRSGVRAGFIMWVQSCRGGVNSVMGKSAPKSGGGTTDLFPVDVETCRQRRTFCSGFTLAPSLST